MSIKKSLRKYCLGKLFLRKISVETKHISVTDFQKKSDLNFCVFRGANEKQRRGAEFHYNGVEEELCIPTWEIDERRIGKVGKTAHASIDYLGLGC